MSKIVTKKELEAESGTPEEFAAAVWKACGDLFIEVEEANEAILKYWAEWEKAPRE